MKIAVIANNFQKEEMMAQGLKEDIEIQWLDEVIGVEKAECYIDLLFTPDIKRIERLKQLQPALIIVNEINLTLKNLPENFIRINGWSIFLKRDIVEASGNDTISKSIAEKIISFFNKTTEWVPDKPGFISARVIAMIINEAYFAFEEGVSSKEEIDTAMKSGTNYPYGPFEWAGKIGMKKIYDLLSELAKTNIKYEAAPELKKEALA